MQESNKRLIDEAIEVEAVKNTFRLTRESLVLNKKLTLTAIGIFLILNILGSFPELTFIFGFLAGIFLIIMQIHSGRTLYAADNIETYVEEIEKQTIGEVVSRHVRTASGVYAGMVLLIALFSFILGTLLVVAGVFKQGMNEQEMLIALSQVGIPVLLVALVVSYVQPLVHSNIILANNFWEGFKAVFSFFSVDVWRSAMQKIYFSYIVKVGFLILGLAFAGVMFTTLGMTVPVVGVVLQLFTLVLMYLFVIIMAHMAVMSRRMVEE
jgi:hypothetical protein